MDICCSYSSRFKFRFIDFDLCKQKSFWPGEIYATLSRLKTYDNLYCIESFKKSTINVNKDALFEYECQKQSDLFFITKRNNISDDTITVFGYNVRSFSKDIDDLIRDDRIINDDIVGLTEKQINPSDSNCKVMKTIYFFNIDFSINENKLLSLASRCRNDVAVSKSDANGVSFLSFKKNSFAKRVFSLMLVYPCRYKNFFRCLNIY